MLSRLLPRAVLCLAPLVCLLPVPRPAPAARAEHAAHAMAGTDDPDAAATCGKCHPDFHKEWQASTHAKAWTDPVYQAALKEKKRPEVCYPCHIPTNVLDKLGDKPAVRDERREEGVTCVVCHKREQAMHGPFGIRTDAHPTEKDPTFTEAGSQALCASCHATKIGPVLPLAKDFEQSGLAQHGKSCIGCHMPALDRHLAVSMLTGKPVGEVRPTRSHDILGPNDAEFCGKAFAFAARLDGKDLVLNVENRTGHRIPGLTLRKFVVQARAIDGGGKPLAEPHREEISSSNELTATEARQVRFAAPAGAEQIEVDVEHWFEDKKVATVKQLRVEIE